MTDDIRDLEPGDIEPDEDDHEPLPDPVPDVATDEPEE